MYDPATDSWTTRKPMPTPRSSFGIAVVDKKIYVIGGFPNPIFPNGLNEVYDTVTDTWETKASMPTARDALCANVVGGKICCIAGMAVPKLIDANEVYDPSTDSWTIKAPMPDFNRFGLADLTSAVVDNKIYVFGGGSSLGNEVFNKIYDTAS